MKLPVVKRLKLAPEKRSLVGYTVHRVATPTPAIIPTIIPAVVPAVVPTPTIIPAPAWEKVHDKISSFANRSKGGY